MQRQWPDRLKLILETVSTTALCLCLGACSKPIAVYAKPIKLVLVPFVRPCTEIVQVGDKYSIVNDDATKQYEFESGKITDLPSKPGTYPLSGAFSNGHLILSVQAVTVDIKALYDEKAREIRSLGWHATDLLYVIGESGNVVYAYTIPNGGQFSSQPSVYFVMPGQILHKFSFRSSKDGIYGIAAIYEQDMGTREGVLCYKLPKSTRWITTQVRGELLTTRTTESRIAAVTDKSIFVLDAPSWTIRNLKLPFESHMAACSADGKLVLCTDFYGNVAVVSLKDGSVVKSGSLPGQFRPTSLAITSPGACFAVGQYETGLDLVQLDF